MPFTLKLMLAVFETLGKENTIRRLQSQIVWNQ